MNEDLIVDAGSALERLAAKGAASDAAPSTMAIGAARTAHASAERFDVIVIGGGQAGLSVGYHLKQRGVRFVILDGQARVGDAWRKRWDSLRLFSPAALDGLDGLPFPAPPGSYPSKDEMADYLEHYAAHFQLPMRTSCRVERLSKEGSRFVVQTSEGELHADQVVVAMAGYQHQRVPALARELSPHVVKLTSSEYKNPAQLAPGSVLVIGRGNSGTEIALDLSRTHRVHLAGPDVGAVPLPMTRWVAFLVMRVVFHRILTLSTALGRKVRPTMMHRATPLIRTKAKHLLAAGVEVLTQRVQGVLRGLPVLSDGRTLDVNNVVFCTGFDAGFSWIDLPIFGADGEPQHEAGVVTREPGLYFVGLQFLYSMSSSMVHGVGRDAQRIATVAAAARVSQPERALHGAA
jgi:putative flavoprotein involved in K+ transport